ncbi:MAG: MmgE/PrpD family protein [Candidatus Binatia bacterium]
MENIPPAGSAAFGRRSFLKGTTAVAGALASLTTFAKLVADAYGQVPPLEIPPAARNVEVALAAFVAKWEVAGPAILLTRFGRFLSNRIFNCHVAGTPRSYHLILGAAGATLAPGANPLAHANLVMSEANWNGVLYGDYTGLAPLLAGEMFPSRDEANRATLLAIVMYIFAHVPASNRHDLGFMLESLGDAFERGGLPSCSAEASTLEVVDDLAADPEGAANEIVLGSASAPEVTKILATFVHDIQYENLPAAEVAAAKSQLKSILGVAYAALEMSPGQKLAAAVAAFGEGGGATALGLPNFKTSARNAAMVNSFLAQILEWEDWTFLTHSGASIVPVVLGTAEIGKRSGKDVIAAIVAGNEILARAGEFLTDVIHTGNAQACHQTELPLLAAKMLGATIDQMRDASGIACTQPQGTSIPAWTADAKGMLSAWPAHTAVTAAHLALAGISGRRDLLENPLGYFYRVADIASPRQLERAVKNLGSVWRFSSELFTKRYPTDGFQLPAVHAAIRVMTVNPTLAAIPRAELPSRLSRILFRIPLVMAASATMFGKGEVALLDRVADPGEPDWTYIALLFDGRYPLAAAIADKQLTHEQYQDAKIVDPVIRSLYTKLELVPDLTMGVFGSRVTITLDSGETFDEFVGCIRENVNDGFDAGDKMRVGAAGLRTPQQIEDLLAAIDDLESFTDVNAFTAML